MARDGEAVDWALASAVALFVEGDEFNVAARCRDLGVSRQTFYKYVRRFTAEGVDGLRVRSRRPLPSGTSSGTDRTSGSGCGPVQAWEEVLVRVRKQEAEAGWDYGAAAVGMRLRERPDLWPQGATRVPSRSTINRVFAARGQLVRTPQRRPRPAVRRFERARPNELWQYDGFRLGYRLGDRTRPMVLQLIDDCSRLELSLQVATSENHDEVWACFALAVSRYGPPAQMLTDNGTAFSGQRRGWTSQFETNLAALGVESITCQVGHPQTCGKGERAHQRVAKWLARQPVAADREQLQRQLDAYREQYNHRGHQALAGATPQARFDQGPIATPNPDLEAKTVITDHLVTSRGAIGVNGKLIGISRRYTGQTATVFRTRDHLAVFIANRLVGQTTIDRTRRYQPLSLKVSAMS
jgi:hypothetical protein